MFLVKVMQNKLIVHGIVSNQNISFLIGTISAADKLYEHLNFNDIFGKYKKNGIDINKWIKYPASYKLSDNFRKGH